MVFSGCGPTNIVNPPEKPKAPPKKNAERVHIRVKIPFPQHFPAKADKRPDTCTAPLRPLPVLPPFTTFPDLFPAFHRTSFSNRPFDNPEHSRSYAPSVPCCRWPRPYPHPSLRRGGLFPGRRRRGGGALPAPARQQCSPEPAAPAVGKQRRTEHDAPSASSKGVAPEAFRRMPHLYNYLMRS